MEAAARERTRTREANLTPNIVGIGRCEGGEDGGCIYRASGRNAERAKEDGASNLLPTTSNAARGQRFIKFAAVKSDSQTEISHVSRSALDRKFVHEIIPAARDLPTAMSPNRAGSAQPHFIFPPISTTEVLPAAWHYVDSPKPKMGNSAARLVTPTLWHHRSTATLALFSLSYSQPLRPAGAHATCVTTLYKTTSRTVSSDRKSTRVFLNQPFGLR
jgi:hypothetical protein